MEGKIFDELAENVVLSDKVSFAIHFDQNAHFTLQMDVGRNHAFLYRPAGLLGCAGNTFSAGEFTLLCQGRLPLQPEAFLRWVRLPLFLLREFL